MTLADALGLTDDRERLLVRGMQLTLAGVLGYGLVTGHVGIVAAGVVALGATLLPALLRREYGYSMDAGLVLWITVAVVLHAAGSLGLYEWFSWYDNLAHAVSGTVVAGLGYASFRAVELHSDEIDVPSAFRALFIVVFVLAAGVVWEVLEFALGGLVTVYGVDDIVTDMVFNAVGAVVVAVWGTDHVDGLVGFFRGRLLAADEE